MRRLNRINKILSTHILTRRMTKVEDEIQMPEDLSTHILTRRMTAILNKNNLSKTVYIILVEYNMLKIYIFSNFYMFCF